MVASDTVDGRVESEERLPRDYGKYRLTRRIATGGMAELFLAHRHDAPLSPLVIKRILPHLASSDGFVSMFLDEARIAASLSHPNIVRIEDIGQVEGTYYLAMEYVHGEDIRCIYNKAYQLQRSLPLSHSIQVVADAARGLAHAHRATNFAGQPMHLVHRDVSPQNILVTYDGHVKVVDFGIAKAAGKVAQTRAGVLKGKYSYMSPEQALGEDVDHRTDLFALGIILYETTTGTRLFKRANELSTLQAIIKGQFTRPSEALPGYPAELERILMTALAREPEARFQSGERLADELEQFLDASRLRASRRDIASFMADLFADKLAEEEGSGEPSVADPALVREELGNRPGRSAQARLETELAQRRRRAPEPDDDDLDATKIERDTDPAPRKGADEANTVAVVAAYRAPAPRGPTAILDDSDPPFSGNDGPKYADPTERIRMRSSDPEPLVRPVFDPPRSPARRPPGSVLLVLAVVAMAAGGISLWAQRGQEPAAPTPVLASIRVLTEPNAEVFVDGDPVGTANGEGRAGPFEVPAGGRLLRVVHGDLRFDRQRDLEIEAGGRYEVEIRARQGFLVLRVAPWARVTVNGKAMGYTPLPRIPLYEGVHEVTLENPDLGVQKRRNVRVIAGEESLVEEVFSESEASSTQTQRSGSQR